MKFNRKKHITERQLRDLSGLSIDAIRVRANTDADFPEMLFVDNHKQKVYDKDKALEWILNIEQPEPLQIVPAHQPNPLSQQGEYKPSLAMKINLERSAKVYPHRLVTLKGIGNHANLGGHYDE